MEPMKIYFDVRDIFRAPRLALGGKKIWIMLQALLAGFVAPISFLKLVTAFFFSMTMGTHGPEVINSTKSS